MQTYDPKALYRAINEIRATYNISLAEAIKEWRKLSAGAKASWLRGV